MEHSAISARFRTVLGVLILAILSVSSCEKKDPNNGVSPDYKQNAGTGSNPNQNNPTVTGTSTLTNPATKNTNLLVGGSGWSNPTCPSTASLVLKGINGETEVVLSFASNIVSGTYQIGPAPSPSVCAMTVVNAPEQPAGVTWIGKSGQVVVNTSSVSITANFSSIPCVQPSFIYPVVSVSGTLACAQ